jgi:hypothetical protein
VPGVDHVFDHPVDAQAQLAQAGIDAKITLLDPSTIRTQLRKGEHQLAVRSYSWENADILEWFLNSKRMENDVPVMARSPYEIDHSFTGIFSMNFRTATVGIRYSFASGLPITPLIGREWEEISGSYIPVWGEPYSQRLQNYQRMDINASMKVIIANRMIVLYMGIINVLNQKNIFRHEYSADYSLRNNQYSIFGRSIFLGIYLPFF